QHALRVAPRPVPTSPLFAAASTFDNCSGLDEGFQLQFRPPTPAPPAIRQFTRHVRKHGAEKGAEFVRSFPDVSALGNAVGVGMALLQDGDEGVVLPHLILAANNHPKSAPIQAMLGEALALNGDRSGGLAAYRKASELLPGDNTVGGTRAYCEYMIKK